MLALGISLMANPKLLLLDEPSLGIAPALAITVFDTLKQLTEDQKLTILIVEQNVAQLLRIVDRVYVMRSGRLVLEESANEMRARDSYWDLF
jgi:branched-chain amino acid transport system ATP-binding protein